MGNKKQLTPRLNKNEPNIIIDGGMEIWPEGTSRSVANNTNAYGAVLFQCGNNTTGVTLTNSQQASIPSGTNIPFSNQVSKTAAGTLAAGTYSALTHHVEGYDVSRLYSDEFTIMFWVKSSVASTRTLSLRNGSSSHSYVQQYTITAANTWQLISLKVPSLSTCPGTILRTNLAGLIVTFNIVSGSTYQTSTLGSWIAGNFLSGVGEDTTWLTGTTHDFSIAGVMVLPGDFRSLTSNTSAYRFLRSGRNFQEELAKTQRYYEKSYALDVVPGTVSNFANVASFFLTSGFAASTTRLWIPFKVVKRTSSPAMNMWNPSTGAAGTGRNVSGAATSMNVIPTETNDSGTTFESASGIDATGMFRFGWQADARF